MPDSDPRPLRTVFLLRHGRVGSAADWRYIGQMDLALDLEGRRQAVWWRDRLASIQFSRIYSSDLVRSLETARIIASNREIPVEALSALREINLGKWDGQLKEDIHRRYPQEHLERRRDLISFRPPGGESFIDLQERVLPVLESITKYMEGHILIAGHAGVNRIILCQALGLSLSCLFRFRQDYACLNLLDILDDSLIVQAMNITAVW